MTPNEAARRAGMRVAPELLGGGVALWPGLDGGRTRFDSARLRPSIDCPLARFTSSRLSVAPSTDLRKAP